MKQFIDEWHKPLDYIVAHTSGSTGAPKEIRLLKSDMSASARATNEFFGIDASSTIVNPLSCSYIAGKMMVVRAVESGAKLIQLDVRSKFDLDNIKDKIKLLPIVPAQAVSLIDNPHWSEKVEAVLIGGAAPQQELCDQLYSLGYNVYVSYGMTETCSHVAIARGDDPTRTFCAMPGIDFSLDERECLCIQAPKFSFGTLITNDMVHLIDAKHFQWRGRVDGVINSGGIKLLPEELEKMYQPYIDVKFYVRGEKDTRWGEIVVLVVEGDGAQAQNALAALHSSNIDRKRLPKKCVALDEFEYTPNGKIKRQ